MMDKRIKVWRCVALPVAIQTIPMFGTYAEEELLRRKEQFYPSTSVTESADLQRADYCENDTVSFQCVL